MFSIGFTEEPLIEAWPGEDGRIGLMRLGSHEERFVAHLMEWQEQKYLDHWQDALLRALDAQPSAIVTDMWTPVQSSHLVWWPIWKMGNELVLHNQLLFFAKHDIVGPHIEVEKLFNLVGKHFSQNDEGTLVSEWRVPIRDVERFLESDSAGRI